MLRLRTAATRLQTCAELLATLAAPKQCPFCSTGYGVLNIAATIPLALRSWIEGTWGPEMLRPDFRTWQGGSEAAGFGVGLGQVIRAGHGRKKERIKRATGLSHPLL